MSHQLKAEEEEEEEEKDFNLPDIDWENSEIKGYNYKKEIN